MEINFTPLTVDIPTTNREHSINLNDTLRGCQQIFFVGYYLQNCNLAAISVEVSGVAVRENICNDGESVRGMIITEPPTTTQHRDLQTRMPLLASNKSLGKINRLTFRVQGFGTTTAPTYDRLILKFACYQQPMQMDLLSPWQTIPSNLTPEQRKVYDGGQTIW